jgi:hypothetical protein
MPAIVFTMPLPLIALVFLLGAPSKAQEPPQEKKFFKVQISKDEIYSYNNLKFKGDFTTVESASGLLAVGRTEAGVTLLVVLGGGDLTIEAPDEFHEKFKTVFKTYPLRTKFTTLYMRLHPKEFDETLGKLPLTKTADEAANEAAFTKAKSVYDQKFLGSYHAGPDAIFPPYKTRFMDFETTDFGQIVTEEGYWLFLRKFGPYVSIYTSKYVNPKQK